MKRELIFTLILLLLKISAVNAQNSKCIAIDYNMALTLNNYKKYDSQLIVTDSMVTFRYYEVKSNKGDEVIIEDDKEKIILSTENADQFYTFKDTKNNTIIESTIRPNSTQSVKILDKPAKIDWNILSEFKEINNINVQKARGV